jgi:membrane dipeptidase
MLMIDAHLDLAWNAHQWNRNLLHSVYTIRAQETNLPEKGRAQGTVAFPEMRRGRIAICFATLMARSTGTPLPHIDYASPTQAFGIARGHLAYYRALENERHIRIITKRAQLEQHIAEWEAWDAAHTEDTVQTPPIGLVVTMESADPILHPEEVGDWFEAGLRIIGPAHYGPGRYAGGTGTELGLSELGVQLAQAMGPAGLMLDVTHLSDQSFWQALEHYKGPAVLASHNNCRALAPHQRQCSDEQLRAIIARGGVIGAAFDIWMVVPDWNRGKTTNKDATMTMIVDHIDHVCQLAGNSQHAGLGSDLDGGYGREQAPGDLDTIADMQQVKDILAKRGYKDDDVANIMYRNWVRLLRSAWQE